MDNLSVSQPVPSEPSESRPIWDELPPFEASTLEAIYGGYNPAVDPPTCGFHPPGWHPPQM
jgi:hypothetical protein